MQRIVKTAKVLRNNWKKTVFFSGLATWGGKWLINRNAEFEIMRVYCEEAKKYGDQKISPMLTSRHVTVILNAAANKKGAKADFEKYCAPILHIAGLKVSIVNTEAEGQAKDLMEIMGNTDCVLIAGGDGTVHEAITGLLRRDDSATATSQFPIGIAPLGRRNTIAFKLNEGVFSPDDRKATIIGESTMSLVRDVLKEVDVMKIEGEQGRPVYSVGQISMGQIRNTQMKLDEYWYLGERMKPYLTFFFQSWRDLSSFWDPQEELRVSYTEPCSGCSRCVDQMFPATPVPLLPALTTHNRRWWHSLLPRRTEPPKPDPRQAEIDRLKSIDNAHCEEWKELNLVSKNILIQQRDGHIDMVVHSPDLERMEFISEGIRLSAKNVLNSAQIVEENSENTEVDSSKKFTTIAAKQYRIDMPVSACQDTGVDASPEALTEDNKLHVVLQEPITPRSKRANGVQEIPHNFVAPVSIPEIVEKSELISLRTPRAPIKELDSLEPEVNLVEVLDTSDSKEQEVNDETTPETVDYDDPFKRWLSIDNENYEIQSQLRVELLPRRVKIYAPSIPTPSSSAQQ